LDIEQLIEPGTSCERYQHARAAIGSLAQGTIAKAKRRAVRWDLPHTNQPPNRGLIHRGLSPWSDSSRIVLLQLQSESVDVQIQLPG
jgi:hypothetical protein